MITKLKFLAIASVAALLMGCGYPHAKKVSPNFEFEGKPNVGIVVFSQSHFDIADDDVFWIKPKGADEEKRVESINVFWGINDFDKNNYEGNLKVYEFPAGDYEFFGWEMHFDQGNTEWSIYGRDLIPFKVRAGEVTYLGNLEIKRVKQSKLFGDKYGLKIENQKERDFKLFAKKIDSISVNKIKVRIAEIIPSN